MIHEVDLMRYLPPFIQEYIEIQKIMSAENPEFQTAWDEDEKIRNNMFILTANEVGIRRYENLLGIHPTTEDTLESRRARVFSRWNDDVPYTLESFINKLKILCGGDDFTVTEKWDEYKLEIETHLGLYGSVEELAHLLKIAIPMNIVVVSTNISRCISNANLFVASNTAVSNVYMVTAATN